jgi:hypothetical protein
MSHCVAQKSAGVKTKFFDVFNGSFANIALNALHKGATPSFPSISALLSWLAGRP